MNSDIFAAVSSALMFVSVALSCLASKREFVATADETRASNEKVEKRIFAIQWRRWRMARMKEQREAPKGEKKR